MPWPKSLVCPGEPSRSESKTLNMAEIVPSKKQICLLKPEIKFPCPERLYEGNDPLAFVLSLNLKRRHLNESQRASIAARIENMKHGRPSGKDANLHLNTDHQISISREKAAEMLNVSPRTRENRQGFLDSLL